MINIPQKLEDLIEVLYWEFDAEKKERSLSERDVFKKKMRGLARACLNREECA